MLMALARVMAAAAGTVALAVADSIGHRPGSRRAAPVLVPAAPVRSRRAGVPTPAPRSFR